VARSARSDEPGISLADRAGVPLTARGRCGICGASIAADGVRLFVERKRPKERVGSGRRSLRICGPCVASVGSGRVICLHR